MKLNLNSSEQVYLLGTVAVKVIVIFLFSILSVAVGIIWYRSELEIEDVLNGSVALDNSAPMTSSELVTGITENFYTTKSVDREESKIKVEDEEIGELDINVDVSTEIIRLIRNDQGIESQKEITLADIEEGQEIEVIFVGPSPRATVGRITPFENSFARMIIVRE